MPRAMTMEEIDAEHEEFNREKGVDELIRSATVESVEAEYRRLVGEGVDDDQ